MSALLLALLVIDGCSLRRYDDASLANSVLHPKPVMVPVSIPMSIPFVEPAISTQFVGAISFAVYDGPGGMRLIDEDAESWDELSRLVTKEPERLVFFRAALPGHKDSGLWAPVVRRHGVEVVDPGWSPEALARARRMVADVLRVHRTSNLRRLAAIIQDPPPPKLLIPGIVHTAYAASLALLFLVSLAWVRPITPRRVRRALARGRCPACRFSLAGLRADDTGFTRCPECGGMWSLERTLLPHAPVAWRHLRATIILVLGVLAARLAYLAFLCPYTLAEDEAFYWLWSKHLDWSYSTKGPGIAWIISLTTWYLGDTEFGVRAAAPVFAAMTAWFAALMAYDATRSSRAAFLTAVVATLAPGFQLMALVMTIDGPYVACWTLAAWAMQRYFLGGAPSDTNAAGVPRAPYAALAGLAIALGFLAKYTALLLIPGLVLFAWVGRRRLRSPRAGRAWLLAGAAIVALGFVPVVVWNQRHGWPTLAHLLGHLHAPGGDRPTPSGTPRVNPLWTLEFLGVQLAIMGPAIVLAAVGAWQAWRSRSSRHSHHGPSPDGGAPMYWVCCAAPILAFYALVSFFAKAQANWAVAAFATCFPLAGLAAARGLDQWREKVSAWRARPAPRPRAGFFRRQPETPAQVSWHATIVVGVLVALAIPRLDLVQRAIDWLQWSPAIRSIWPAKAYIPLHRFTGARTQAEHAEFLVYHATRQNSGLPFVITTHYGQASLMAFYLRRGHEVLCVQSLTPGGRKTQFDFWEHADPNDPLRFGRPALIFGDAPELWARAFERVEPAGQLRGEVRPGRGASLGYSFKGFAPTQPARPPNAPEP